MNNVMQKEWLSFALDEATTRLIDHYHGLAGLDYDLAYVRRLTKCFIYLESRGNADAVSSARAIGLLQFKPLSASQILRRCVASQYDNVFAAFPSLVARARQQRYDNQVTELCPLGACVDASHLLSPSVSVALWFGELLLCERASLGAVANPRFVAYVHHHGLSALRQDVSCYERTLSPGDAQYVEALSELFYS